LQSEEVLSPPSLFVLYWSSTRAETPTMVKKKAPYTHFTKKTEKQHYLELKSLPIRMSDRRILYTDVQEIYNFEREIRGKRARKKAIPFFSIRMFWTNLKFPFKFFTLWENSLREIEIQRGTITASVFHFIKYTLFFNLGLTLIVFGGIVIPHVIILHDPQHNSDLCKSGFNGTDPSQGKQLSDSEFAECCYKLHINSPKTIITNKQLTWLITVAEILGGTSSMLDTIFFYGFYTPHSQTTEKKKTFGKWLPLLYIASVVAVLIVSFCILIRNIAAGIKEIVRNKDGDVCVFSELIFCGYNHRSKNENEARFKRKLWLHHLRVALKQAKSWGRSTKITRKLLMTRVFVFATTSFVIGITSWAIYKISDDAYTKVMEIKAKGSQELVDILQGIGLGLLPSLAVSKLEKYSLEGSTALILYRSLSVRLLSVVVAVIRVFTRNYGSRVKPYTCTDHGDKTDIRASCWESILAREFYKILLTELILKSFLTFVVNPFRKMLKKLFFRIKLMRAIGTLRFNVIRHSIDIINIQVMCWIGFYFAPWYPLIVCIYLVIIFYVKKFAVLVICVGAPEAHKVTRTTTIFLTGKLVSFMLVLVFLIVVLGYLEPSKGCGPFATFYVPWLCVEDFLHVQDEASNMFLIMEHIASLSVYVPLLFISLTILYFYYSRSSRLNETAECIKDLIYMENQDKQYLASKLMQLRSMNRKQNYYDPLAIYDSERRYVTSSTKKPNLDKQWRDLKDAVLPFGTTPGVKRGALSAQMKKLAADLMKKSSTSQSNKKAKSSMFKKPFKTKSRKKKRKNKKKSAREDSSEAASQRVVRKRRKRGHLNQLMNKIMGSPYDNPSPSSSSGSGNNSHSESETDGEEPQRRPRKGVKPGKKQFMWEGKKKEKNVKPFSEELGAPIKRHKRNKVGPADDKHTPDAKDAMKTVGDKRAVKAKKHLLKRILSDPGLSPSVEKDGSGISSTQDSKNKHYVWDKSKSNGSHKSTSHSLASGNKKPAQKTKSMGGMESKPGPKSSEKGSTKGSSTTGNDGKKFVWDIKSQTPKPQNAEKGSTKGNSSGNDGKKFVWDIKSQTPKPQNPEQGFKKK
ncbi:unnamed protein product, partial [Allacma fusca]